MFNYGTTNNNGNVLSQTITVPTETRNGTIYNGFTATHTYTYDSLNRIKDAKELIGTTQQWKQTFSYDRYGNRRFDEANTTTIASGCATAVCNPQIDPNTNKLIGYTYDNSGNTKIDAESRQFSYNGENKQTEVKDSQNQTVGKYFYDGDGKRVKKISNTETVIFVYDAAGKLVAEYANQTSQNPQVSYLTTDHLGSPRVLTDANGNVISRRDFMPFGEEIYTAQRTQGLGYTADTVRQKFTSYERDDETELDFAQARMYANRLGRFTTTDPIVLTQDRLVDPQQINLYVYVRNNPLILIDPTGEIIDDSSLKDNENYQKWKKAFLATKSGQALWDKYNNDKNFTLTVTMGENSGGKYGAETVITKDSFNSEGKLVSANIILGTEFAEKAASGDYPIGSKMTPTDSSMASGGTFISRLDRAVGFLAHEFGHVEDANKAGAEKWLKDNSLLEQNKANFEKFGQKGLDSPELIKQCGCKSISELKTGREIRAEGYSIPVIQEHFKQNGGVPGRIKNAIKEYNKKYGSP